MDLPTIADGEEITLRFAQWFNYDSADKRCVRIRTWNDGNWSGWTDLTSDKGGASGDWVPRDVPLSAYGGRRVRISFYHEDNHEHSGYYDRHYEDPGWFVDDVEILHRAGPPLMVSTLADEDDGDLSEGDYSLREALGRAGVLDGADVIEFAPELWGGVIELDPALGQLVIDSDVEIRGPGAERMTIDAGEGSRVFSVGDVTASIEGLTVTGGYAAGDETKGGAILSAGALELAKVAVTGSHAALGGGVANNGGELKVIDSLISGNTAGSFGGIGSWGGELVVLRSTIAGNNVGIGEASLGGGVGNLGGQVDVLNSTVSGNTAGRGGGIHHAGEGARLEVVNVTITANEAGVRGGGICSEATAVLYNTILAGNLPDDACGVFEQQSDYNLIGMLDEGNRTGLEEGDHTRYGTAARPVDAILGPLADNGGPTPTHALRAGSPAIDMGDNAAAEQAGLTSDQRGNYRFCGVDLDAARVDIGAYEAYIPGPIVVSTLADEHDADYGAGRLSLREALVIAAVAPGRDEIRFESGLTGTIALNESLGQLVVDSDVDILGPGSDRLTIDADGHGRVLYVGQVEASVTGLTLARGLADPQAEGAEATGGGVYNEGALWLTDVVITGSGADVGGGVHNAGELALSGVRVTSNTSTGDGAGLFNSGALSVAGSTIDGNEAGPGSAGGGLANVGTAIVQGTTIEGNSATGGGGLANAGVLVMGDSSVIDNDAELGAGISNRSLEGGGAASLALSNVTISGNDATDLGGGIHSGNPGAVGTALPGELRLTNVTIAANTAAAASGAERSGGGIHVAAGDVTLRNTIVAGNTRAGAADDVQGGFVDTSSHNLIGTIDGSAGLDEPNSPHGTDDAPLGAELEPLSYNVGTTQTHLLKPSSPAVDAGENAWAAAAGLTTDQRAQPRFIRIDAQGDDFVDIGAHELFLGAEQVVSTLTDEDDTTNDDLSLREALVNVATLPGQDVIRFDESLAGKAILLDDALGELAVDSDVIIEGPGSGLLTISALGAGRILHVVDNVAVTISGLNLSAGRVGGEDDAGRGGGIYNEGDLTLTDVRLSGCWANLDGGAIHTTSDGALTMIDSVLSANIASSGGAISSDGPLTLTTTRLIGNTASHAGGGIASRGIASLEGVLIEGNSAGSGGGIANSGNLTVGRTTISDNTVRDSGGGIENTSGSVLRLEAVTLWGNLATDGGGISLGGPTWPWRT